MAQLKDSEKREIVQRLAVFESPSEIADWASEEFGKDISRSQVFHYDPTRSDRMGEKWEKLFERTREDFLEDVDTIPLSHRAVRLRELQRLYKYLTKGLHENDEAGEVIDVTEAARMLKQAAKEVGGKFTNVERKEHSGPDGGPIEVKDTKLSDAELARIAAEAETHTNGKADE